MGRPARSATKIDGDVSEVFAGWLEAAEREQRPATFDLWTTYVEAHWTPFFLNASDLTDPVMLARYVSQRLTKVAAGTVRLEVSGLRSLLAWCAREEVGLLTEVPKVPGPAKGAAGTKAQNRVRVDITPEQAEQIIEALPERLRTKVPCRAFFRVLWETGLRRGTLLRLEAPGDYHRGATTLRIRSEADKAAYGREIPLTPRAREALDSVCPKRGALFEAADHRHHLRRAAEAAGVPKHLASHLGPHDFRHARTTHLLNEGGSLTGVAYLVGHKRVTTTDRYAHAKEAAARAALSLVSGREAGRGDDTKAQKRRTPPRGGRRLEPSFTELCGREDSNLHSLSATRSLAERLRIVGGDSRGKGGVGDVADAPIQTDSGRRVPLIEAAIRYVEAVESDDAFALMRGLELAELVTQLLEADAGVEATSEPRSPRESQGERSTGGPQ